MTTVMVFTPTWLKEDGQTAMRPETEASLMGQELPDGVTLVWEVGLHNPHPGQSHKNVLAQYQWGRETFLESDAEYLLLYEHDMVMPAGAVGKMLEAMAGGGYLGVGQASDERRATSDEWEIGVVYAPYLLRHGSWVLNTWEYVNDHALGESFTLNPKLLATARTRNVVRVCGCGFGCTLIRRSVVERFVFRDGGGDQWSPDIPFAYDCLYAGVVAVARMDVDCDHLDGGLRLRPYGGGMTGFVKVKALQTLTAIDGRGGTRRLIEGEEYELGGTLASDLMRAGYVQEIEEIEKPVTEVPEYEAAALEPAEKAVRRAVKRRPRSGL